MVLRKIWKYIKGIFRILWYSIRDGIRDKIFRMSAALAYYAIFSIAPILILVIGVANSFFGRKAVEGEVYGQIREYVGDAAALQIQSIIANTMASGQSYLATAISIPILIFTATGVFTEVQDSINVIWCLKPKPKKGWLKFLFNRLISFVMLISLGVLLLVLLAVNTVLNMVGDQITMYFPNVSVYYTFLINWVVTFSSAVFVFGAIFKVLPDADVKWKNVLAGAIFTTVLFLLGKLGISFYLGRSRVNTMFGAASSTIILLLWIYYSAIILYIGAEFTKHYAQWRGSQIYPNDYAVWIEKVEIEKKDRLAPLKEHVEKETDE